MRPAMSSVSARATIASFCVSGCDWLCASSGRAANRPVNAAVARASVANAARGTVLTGLRCHAIERAALIVRDEHGAVLVYLDIRGTSPARAIRALPSAHEVFDACRESACYAHAHDLRA